MTTPCTQGQPEPTIARWLAQLGPATGAAALDVAAGRGRHSALLRQHGYDVLAIDRDPDALVALRALGDGVTVHDADLEGAPWPLGDRRFDVVLVVNYLWRPLLGALADAVAPGGHLLYETFLVGHERFGRPRNPDFLLRSGELRTFAEGAGLEVLEFSEGEVGTPPFARRQRLLARRATV